MIFYKISTKLKLNRSMSKLKFNCSIRKLKKLNCSMSKLQKLIRIMNKLQKLNKRINKLQKLNRRINKLKLNRSIRKLKKLNCSMSKLKSSKMKIHLLPLQQNQQLPQHLQITHGKKCLPKKQRLVQLKTRKLCQSPQTNKIYKRSYKIFKYLKPQVVPLAK